MKDNINSLLRNLYVNDNEIKLLIKINDYKNLKCILLNDINILSQIFKIYRYRDKKLLIKKLKNVYNFGENITTLNSLCMKYYNIAICDKNDKEKMMYYKILFNILCIHTILNNFHKY